MMAETDGTIHVRWPHPREIVSVLGEDGRPRPMTGTASGFDLSWLALDALAAAKASGRPCEIVLTGYSRRPDGTYWYDEAVSPNYLREVLGWSERNGTMVPACPECAGYPKHARGCSLAS